MKHKIKELWYFIQWLFKDTNWITVISILMMASAWTLPWWPNPYGFFMAVFLCFYAVGCFLYLIVYKSLEYQYSRYKKEQQELFDKIKGSK